jgi:hypothetical protein
VAEPRHGSPVIGVELGEPGRPWQALLAEPLEGHDGATTWRASDGATRVELRLGPLGGDPARREGELTVVHDGRSPRLVGLRCALSVAASDDPGWLIPGLFYGENRPVDCRRLFPRFTPRGGDPARFESEHWAFRADRAATPAVFAWGRCGGAALLTGERSTLGLSGVGLALVDDRAVLRLDFPYREEPVAYDGSQVPAPPEATFAALQPGEPARASFSLFLLGPDRHGYDAVLRSVAPAGSSGDSVAWVSVEQAAELAAHGLYRWHYRRDPPVLIETAAFDRDGVGTGGDRQAMHVSWVSGTPYAHALLAHGRRRGAGEYVAAATAVLDNIAAHLAPGGTYWGQWSDARGWGVGWTPEPGRLHARTLADATLFQLRALVAERSLACAHPTWEAAVRSNLDVACAGQRADGAIGSAFDAGTGAVIDWRGTAGLAYVAPLAEAATAFGEPRYLDAARRAGAHFESAVRAEYLCGAPEDVDLSPTSEDGYLAVISYVCLWRADPDERWLELARRAAAWTLTFRYSYDVCFSEQTMLGRYGFCSLGADQASPPNQHLHAFGLICLPEMAELAAALDDDYLLARTRQNLSCFRQFVARGDGDFDAWRGMTTERYYQTACSQAKGMLGTLAHAWTTGVLLYACEEVISRSLAGLVET